MTATLGYCLKSKCESLSICCGLINLQRRVDLEGQDEMKQMGMEEHKQGSKSNVQYLYMARIEKLKIPDLQTVEMSVIMLLLKDYQNVLRLKKHLALHLLIFFVVLWVREIPHY